MSRFVDWIKNLEDVYSAESVSVETINAAEVTLGLHFSDEYRDYLENFGTASFDIHELTGISSAGRLDVIAVTERYRRFYPNFPQNVYVVEDLLMDHVVMVQDENGVVYSYGPGNVLKEQAGSLFDLYSRE